MCCTNMALTRWPRRRPSEQAVTSADSHPYLLSKRDGSAKRPVATCSGSFASRERRWGDGSRDWGQTRGEHQEVLRYQYVQVRVIVTTDGSKQTAPIEGLKQVFTDQSTANLLGLGSQALSSSPSWLELAVGSEGSRLRVYANCRCRCRCRCRGVYFPPTNTAG